MKNLILVTVVLIIVIALFVYVNASKGNVFTAFHEPLVSISPSPTVLPTLSPTQSPLDTKVVQLTVKNGKITSGPKTLNVKKNQMVVLQITADTDDELSLPGYDKHVFLQKGKMVVLSFLTTLSGNFSYMLESSKNILGSIEVQE